MRFLILLTAGLSLLLPASSALPALLEITFEARPWAGIPALNIRSDKPFSFGLELSHDLETWRHLGTGDTEHLDFEFSPELATTPHSYFRARAVGAIPNSLPVQGEFRTAQDSPTIPFAGPFASWLNVKTDFGAVGDGQADDTQKIQAALDAIRNNSQRAALYFPRGTYRLTQTLAVKRSVDAESKDIIIAGEDPAVTAFVWDGAPSGVMLRYEAWYSKFTRLALDGKNKARCGVAHGPMFSTHNEFSDVWFKNLAVGIEAGTGASLGNAETVVERCRFEHCSETGISIQDANSLDWFIRRSQFTECKRGVSNLAGAGNFHVYESIFRDSSEADVSIGNTGYFSIRNNHSKGARAFFSAAPLNSCASVTIQGNAVCAPTGVPIRIGNLGPVLLIDNYFEDFQGTVADFEPSAGLALIGNRYTASNSVRGSFSPIRMDEFVVGTNQNVIMPMPSTPPPAGRTVIEVAPGAGSAAIQSAVDSAALQDLVVHLPAAIYLIDRTIVVPPRRNLWICGDGAKTALRWAGQGRGPVLRILGPSKARLQDLKIYGDFDSITADGIVIEHADRQGGRIVGDQISIERSRQIGLWVDGIASTRCIFEALYHAESASSIVVDGFAGRGAPVSIRGGASANNGVSYDVRNGGRLLVQDMWYETGTTNQQFLMLTNSGTLTIHGANIALRQSKLNSPAVQVRDFNGTATFLATRMYYPETIAEVSGNSTVGRVLMLGTVNHNLPMFHAGQDVLSIQQSFQILGANSFSFMENTGSADAPFLRKMLLQTRSDRKEIKSEPDSEAVDLSLYRVWVDRAGTGIRIAR